MGIVIKEFDGSLVTPKDAAVMNELIFQSYGIFNGCNISFLGVNKIMIASGRMIVKGRQVVITGETIAAQLSSGGTKRGRLYLKIDLSNLDNPGTFLTQVADELPELIQQDDVNYSNGIFEVELCNYDVSETAISNIVETCPMITGSVDLLKSIEEVLANTEEGKAVDALVIKELTDSLAQVKTYVGEDGMLHFIDSEGADTVLNFSSSPIILTNINLDANVSLTNISHSSGGTSKFTLNVSKYKTLKLSDFSIRDRGTWGASALTIMGDNTTIMNTSLQATKSNYSSANSCSYVSRSYSGNTYDISAYDTITITLTANTGCTDAGKISSYVSIKSIVIE